MRCLVGESVERNGILMSGCQQFFGLLQSHICCSLISFAAYVHILFFSLPLCVHHWSLVSSLSLTGFALINYLSLLGTFILLNSFKLQHAQIVQGACCMLSPWCLLYICYSGQEDKTQVGNFWLRMACHIWRTAHPDCRQTFDESALAVTLASHVP